MASYSTKQKSALNALKLLKPQRKFVAIAGINSGYLSRYRGCTALDKAALGEAQAARSVGRRRIPSYRGEEIEGHALRRGL